MADATGMTAEEMEAEWQKISRFVEELMSRIVDPGGFPVPPGSMLAHDNAISSPRQISHAFQACLVAGVDHLHALKTLVRDTGILHAAAPFSLARGALENLSIAYWLLHPAERSERMERVLRWNAQNIKDSHTALVGRDLPNTDKGPKLARLEAAAKQILPAVKFRTIEEGYTSTFAVSYANKNSTRTGDVLLAWRLCSGYAHGRLWASLGASDRDESPTDDPDVVGLRLSANDGAVLWVARESKRLASDVVELYNQRSAVRRFSRTASA